MFKGVHVSFQFQGSEVFPFRVERAGIEEYLLKNLPMALIIPTERITCWLYLVSNLVLIFYNKSLYPHHHPTYTTPLIVAGYW